MFRGRLPLDRRQIEHLSHHPLRLVQEIWQWEWHALVVWAMAAVILMPLLAMMLKPVLVKMLVALHHEPVVEK